LIGAADTDGKILNFAIDRLDEVKTLPEHLYKKCTQDLEERFEDIVGVTLYEDRPISHIVFWASDASKNYILTKPINETQIMLCGEKDTAMRDAYPNLSEGVFFSIDCIENYELIRELTSFGKYLIVLQPHEIQEKVYERISSMMENYSRART
jgi:predicted DNA-binding transcriptional regulator YafY